jgi:transcriptional regulator with XRE-family HTH domain
LEVEEMDSNFIRDRITELRLLKGVSEYQMSYDLGHSRGYIYNISSGKSLPPMNEFLSICDYFEISPAEFFNENIHYPGLIQKALDGMQQLSDDDLLLTLNLINRLTKSHS